MQLSIKATGERADVLSYLLAKNPHNLYDRNEKGARVRLFYPVFTETEAEAVLYVTPDPVGLVRNRANDITQYINDREFAVSSLFLSYARSALATALNGRVTTEEFQPWAEHAYDLELGFGPVASDLPNPVVQNLFEALGYEVEIERGTADYSFELKGRSTARFLTLRGRFTVQDALRHLFVMIPVLDDHKHYYIKEEEVEKLQRYGEGWLDTHPLRETIIKRSLRFRELIDLMPPAPVLNPHTDATPTADVPAPDAEGEEANAPKIRLNDLRYQAIVDTVQSLPHRRSIVDFGSGEGKLSRRLAFIRGVEELLAVEPSEASQLRAVKSFEKLSDQPGFLPPTPLWGSLFYFDDRLQAKDVMILCEVIEHIDEHRLPRIMETIFRDYRPETLIVTTPNQEYNQVYDMSDAMRHDDHRFEWTRAQFADWCAKWTESFGVDVALSGIGEESPPHGHPTQMAVFTRRNHQQGREEA